MTGAGQPVAAFPWDEIMGFAFGHWRLSPAEFWASTPREIAAAIAFHRGRSGRLDAPSMSDLAALMHRFPDRP